MKIERSLFFQQLLNRQAQLSPEIRTLDGKAVIRSDTGQYYVVMRHFPGKSPLAGTADSRMMYAIGKAAGRMHQIMAGVAPRGEVWTPDSALLQEQWKINYNRAISAVPRNTEALRAIERQGVLLTEIDLSLFDRLERGWCHWDCWVDNLLIGPAGEVIFVDFDTVQYSFPAIDIARLLLSAALHRGVLRQEPVQAFLAGYREERPFGQGLMSLAFKLLWCREAHWWLKAEMDDFSAPPRRFAEEMLWLTREWGTLEERFERW